MSAISTEQKIKDTAKPVDERTPLNQNAPAYTPKTNAKPVVKQAPSSKNPIPQKAQRTIGKGSGRTRKNVRDFRKKGRDYATWRGRIGVHLEVESIDIKELNGTILKDFAGWKVVEHYDVVHLSQSNVFFHDSMNRESMNREMLMEFSEKSLKEEVMGGFASEEEKEDKDPASDYDATSPQIFIFSFGAVVFWNLPNSDWETDWLQKHLFCFPDICGERFDERAIESANDEIEFEYRDKLKMRQDVVQLKTRESGEKLAVSFALAKSSLLSIYEWELERSIERNSQIPEELATSGKIHMTSLQISKEIGNIFLIKHGINLDSNLHDTPEEFWEDDRFEETYDEVTKYFEINKRLDLVNSRLQMIQDLHQVLREQEENNHAVYLEWIIIILIVVEVLFEFVEPLYYHHFYPEI